MIDQDTDKSDVDTWPTVALPGTVPRDALPGRVSKGKQSGSNRRPQTALPGPGAPLDAVRELIRRRHTVRGSVTLRHWRGAWMVWRGAHWSEVEPGRIKEWIYRETESAVYIKPTTGTDGATTTEAVPWRPNRRKVADVLDALAAACHLADDIEPPRWSAVVHDRALHIAVSNGLLDIHSGQLVEHDPRFFNTNSLPFAYDPGAPDPAEWLKFLDMLWPDDPQSIAALQEWFGYVISGRTDLQKILLLVGPTRGGKGTIAYVLVRLIGEANHAAPTLSSLITNFGLSPLLGKTLAVIGDARIGGSNIFQVVERLLTISGEDTLTVDRKFREPWTGKLGTRIMIVSNELPNLGDASGTIAHRFVPLVLRESWLGREDPGLRERLAGELPGILNWSLRGLERLAARSRFKVPDTSMEVIDELKEASSPMTAFLRERCELAPGNEISVSDLYGGWLHWCAANQRRVTTKQIFGRDLRSVAPTIRIKRIRVPGEADGAEFDLEYGDRERVYQGVKLRPQWQTLRTIAAHDPDQGKHGHTSAWH